MKLAIKDLNLEKLRSLNIENKIDSALSNELA